VAARCGHFDFRILRVERLDDVKVNDFLSAVVYELSFLFRRLNGLLPLGLPGSLIICRVNPERKEKRQDQNRHTRLYRLPKRKALHKRISSFKPAIRYTSHPRKSAAKLRRRSTFMRFRIVESIPWPSKPRDKGNTFLNDSH
jgi:hypothetical protein